MLCEMCKANDANVHIKQVVNGEARELHVCGECAEESSLTSQTPAALASFLFGTEADPISEENDKVCPLCHMRRSDFKKLSRLGCAACYDTFMEDLAPIITAVHRVGRHVGKVPCDNKIGARIVRLQKSLEGAVGLQDFEKAAKLRDEIRLLEEKC